MPPGYFIGCGRFNCVVDHDDKSRMLLAEIQHFANSQRFINMESLFAQVLAEPGQFAGEVDQGAHELRLPPFLLMK